MNLFTSQRFDKEIKRLVKKYPSLKIEFPQLVELLRNDPKHGTYLGKDCYKIRIAIASKGRGKSGGARIITCFKLLEDTLFLLSIYDKSEKENMDDHEIDEILEEEGIKNG